MRISQLLALVVVAASLVPAATLASEGSSAKGGGDALFLRWTVTQEYLLDDINGLKADLLLTLRNLTSDVYSDTAAREAMTRLLQNSWVQLERDIAGSPYVVRASCIDHEGKRRHATSGMNDLNGEICFDLDALASIRASRAEIIALALHEHAHHFGYLDENHAIAREALPLISEENLKKWRWEDKKRRWEDKNLCNVAVQFDLRGFPKRRLDQMTIEINGNEAIEIIGFLNQESATANSNGQLFWKFGYFLRGDTFRVSWKASNPRNQGIMRTRLWTHCSDGKVMQTPWRNLGNSQRGSESFSVE